MHQLSGRLCEQRRPMRQRRVRGRKRRELHHVPVRLRGAPEWKAHCALLLRVRRAECGRMRPDEVRDLHDPVGQRLLRRRDLQRYRDERELRTRLRALEP